MYVCNFRKFKMFTIFRPANKSQAKKEIVQNKFTNIKVSTTKKPPLKRSKKEWAKTVTDIHH